MTKKIHKIEWKSRWNKTKSDIHIEVTDVDCMVTKVNHPCAKWAVGEYWHIVCKWFQKKGATVTLGEEINQTDVMISYILKDNLELALLSAIDERQKWEDEQEYDSDSALLAGWKENLFALRSGKLEIK